MTTWVLLHSAQDSWLGGEMKEYQCIEHPRVTRLVQRTTAHSEHIESFHIDGLPQYYHTLEDALRALHANGEES